MTERFVIVGGGQSGAQAATTLRESGFGGSLVMVGEEPDLPYQRPPLSKKFLLGEQSAERIELRPASYYRDLDVEVRTGIGARRIERDAKRLHLTNGDSVPYDKLLLATGSRPRSLPIPGAGLAGVYYLRTKADAVRLRADMIAGQHLVVIGGGYIGLEIAAAGVSLGLRVTVLESAPRVLGRVTGTRVAEHFTALHRSRGVEVRCCATVERLEGAGRVSALRCDGESLQADLVMVGIGVTACDTLALEAGLPCDDGIVVDANCRTGDPAIFAAGDCTNHPNPLVGRRLRLECVHNAVEQAKCAALNMLGEDRDYAIAPWFWSDQYDTKWQSVGLSAGHDSTVLRGDPAEGRFAFFYLTGGVLTAVDAVNSPRDFMACRKLIPQRPKVSAERLGDPAIPLLEVV
jgi:3-phenylpropionate/trans-cinnamate dioxygenase ferredoxin reductase subunit